MAAMALFSADVHEKRLFEQLQNVEQSVCTQQEEEELAFLRKARVRWQQEKASMEAENGQLRSILRELERGKQQAEAEARRLRALLSRSEEELAAARTRLGSREAALDTQAQKRLRLQEGGFGGDPRAVRRFADGKMGGAPTADDPTEEDDAWQCAIGQSGEESPLWEEEEEEEERGAMALLGIMRRMGMEVDMEGQRGHEFGGGGLQPEAAQAEEGFSGTEARTAEPGGVGDAPATRGESVGGVLGRDGRGAATIGREGGGLGQVKEARAVEGSIGRKREEEEEEEEEEEGHLGEVHLQKGSRHAATVLERLEIIKCRGAKGGAEGAVRDGGGERFGDWKRERGTQSLSVEERLNLIKGRMGMASEGWGGEEMQTAEAATDLAVGYLGDVGERLNMTRQREEKEVVSRSEEGDWDKWGLTNRRVRNGWSVDEGVPSGLRST